MSGSVADNAGRGSGVIAAAGGGGVVAQIVRTDYKTETSSTSAGWTGRDTAIPTTSVGIEVFSATITPQSTSNILLIEVHLTTRGSGDGIQIYGGVWRDSETNALASTGEWIDSTDPQPMYFAHSETAPSTSSQEYKVRVGYGNGSTVYINCQSSGSFQGAAATSGITITEYTP